MRSRATVFVWCALLAISGTAWALPYIPADGAQVIERLPGKNDPAQQEFKRLRNELALAQDKLPAAANLARRYIDEARREGDPRYLGYAQAVLSPWWGQENPPTEVRVLRATLWQSTHQFPKALTELDAVLKADRNNAQAWLTRATVLMVQGNYEQAKNSCARLYPLAPELITVTCLTNVASLNGQGAQSYALLATALKKDAEADIGIKIWVLTLLAEMATRSGDDNAAEAHFRKALSLDGTDSYLLGAYADFLLDRQRSSEVVSLLKKHTRVDGLLLRYAIALESLQPPESAAQTDILRARFSAAMMRADTVHQREQSRFELRLLHNPKTALALAQQNWDVQKEPADVRVFLEAAVAANDKGAAQPVLTWLKQTRLEDRAIAALAAKLGESS